LSGIAWRDKTIAINPSTYRSGVEPLGWRGFIRAINPNNTQPMTIWQVIIIFVAAMILSLIVYFGRFRKED